MCYITIPVHDKTKEEVNHVPNFLKATTSHKISYAQMHYHLYAKQLPQAEEGEKDCDPLEPK